jgi:hypothetical protein
MIEKILQSPSFDSYRRNLVGWLIGGAVIVGGTKVPIFYTHEQWVQYSNALWAAAIPTLLKFGGVKRGNAKRNQG